MRTTSMLLAAVTAAASITCGSDSGAELTGGDSPGGVSTGPGGGTGPGNGGASSGPGGTGGGGGTNGAGGAGGAEDPGGSGGGSTPPGGASPGPTIPPTGGAAPQPGFFPVHVSGPGGGGFNPNSLGIDCEELITMTGELSCDPADVPVADNYIGYPCGEACLRDTYVAAAILYCWGARCTTDSAMVEPYQQCARANLCYATDLCSNAPGFCTEPCLTVGLWECDTDTGIGQMPAGGCPQDCPF